MHKNALLATAAALLLATAGAATAQTSPPGSAPGSSSPQMNSPASPSLDSTTRPSQDMNAPSSPMGAIAPSRLSPDLKGKDLLGADGNKIGSIEDVAGDKLIVGVGGFLGIGERKVALAQNQVTVTGSGNDLKATTSLTRDEIKALPEYAGTGSSSRPLPTTPSGDTSR